MTGVPPQAAPERLTGLLRRAGVLDSGEVIDVAVDSSRDTLISRIARLRLTYDGRSDASPSHLFFNSAAVATPAGLLPRCYAAGAEPQWHLILEDLTVSHQTLGDWPLPPAVERLHAVVAAHARFHAVWWDDARLGVSVGVFADTSGALDRCLETFPKDFAAFADRLGDRLSAERRAVYERFIAAAPRLLARYRSHRHLTIVHGDAHLWNALLPRDQSFEDVRLIDWDAWRVDTATDDLAYMIAVHCFPDWRRRYERESLQRYHDALVAGGVRGYAFDALREDYRQSVLWQITTPMWQANHGLVPAIWWNHLDRIMSAVHDLGCLDLID